MKKGEINFDIPTEAGLLHKALWSIFPGPESFNDFVNQDRDVSESAVETLIGLAFDRKLIDKKNPSAFVDILKKDASGTPSSPWPAGMTFSDILDILREGQSVNSLLDQANRLARRLCLPAVSAPMVTRLKKNFVLNTSKKRSLIRLMAFMLALKRPDLNWHYERLAGLSRAPMEPAHRHDTSAGAMITLHLHAPGNAITPEDVAWLHDELVLCLNDLRMAGHLGKKTIEPIGATAFNLKSPKRIGPAEEPGLYNRSIRNLLAVSHQMAVRWLLCPLSNPEKKLIMIITAGSFSGILPQRLLVRLPLSTLCDSGIYLTGFACLCARTAGVKADLLPLSAQAFADIPQEEPLWFICAFWPNHAHDFIPALLKPGMLPLYRNDPAYTEFQLALQYPEQRLRTTFGAITMIHRYPRSLTLLLEIARVLCARNMPVEADAVISLLLLSHPDSAAARYLRILIWCGQAQTAPCEERSALAFERGLAEGRHILNHLTHDGEIRFAMAMLHLGQATILMRRKPRVPHRRPQDRNTGLLAHLNHTRSDLRRGIAASATGQALPCLYGLLCVEALIMLHSNDPAFLIHTRDVHRPDWPDVFHTVTAGLLSVRGWFRQTSPLEADTNDDLKRLILLSEKVFSRYESTVLGRSYTPSIKYLFALMILDFFPQTPRPAVEKVLHLLQTARLDAEKLISDHLCVYSPLRGYLSPDRFIKQIDEVILSIEAYTDTTQEQTGQDAFCLNPDVRRHNFLLAEILRQP